MMKTNQVNNVVVSSDENYVVVNGQQYVSVNHILATQQWLEKEKQRNNNNKISANNTPLTIQAA